MALMSRMRDLAPVFIIGVGVMFVLFMIISDSNVLEALGGQTNVVGSINGEDVTYQEFNQFVDRAMENYKAQSGEDVDPDNMDRFRDQVWDEVVRMKLFEQKMDEYDVAIADDEIREVILGENPPPFLTQGFVDSATGQFNRQAYEQAILDPRNEQILVQAEDLIRQQLMQQKLQNILFSAVTVSEGEIRRNFIDKNVRMTAEYLLADVRSFPDTTVAITDDEIRDYYDEHKDEFKQVEQRQLNYVLFDLQPSKADSNAALTQLYNVRARLAEDDTADFKTFVEYYSEEPYSLDTVSADALPGGVLDSADEKGAGSIIGPVATETGYALYHVADILPSDDTVARASHILITSTAGEDSVAKLESERVYAQLLAGADFATTAKARSKDPGSAVEGGDLGWFGKGRMVPQFERAAFTGTIGEIQPPVKTAYGYHIIKTTGRSTNEYVVEKISYEVRPSGVTRDDVFNEANDFAYLAENNGFEKEAEVAGYEVKETIPFEREVYSIPGIGYNRALINFAFENDEGDVSEPHTATDGYVVGVITAEIPEGYRPFEEAKEEAKRKAIQEKKYDMALAALKAANVSGGDLAAASESAPELKYNTAQNFTRAGSVPTIGLDYAFGAAAYELPLNEISDPVRGARGYYLIQVTQRSAFDSTAYAGQRQNLRAQLLNQKRQQFLTRWEENLKRNAEIVDNRHRFYGR
ncbi:MAG: hypothetical protein GF419_01940 [Ignavibacteriales bacterium]|nr:hypothetical protein [Ignavibacteriales bacterium]